MLRVNDLRNSFIDFFRERGHKIILSSSLMPRDDPSLLFTNAGMVQFKPMFAGTVDLEYTRAASVQKCLRTSDLENVGKTKRHLAFFEMLGNFSFGDYFKVEAIEYAWDYSTDVIGFPEDNIWISIYKDDDEAFGIWKNRIGIPEKKIIRLGKKDNFWGPAGDSGACGPCTELYIDRGREYGCGSDACNPGCDCERFLEYWNLVFNQYYQDTNGNHTPLPQTGIDTGMGLERLATIVQNVDSVYETDEFKRLVNFICDESGIEYRDENIDPIKVIMEHSRTLAFAMSDGVYPSNEGRGYVLRRILRRAVRFSRQIGISQPFIFKIVDPVSEILGDVYPELRDSIEGIKNVIESEEKRFLETLENGMDRLEEIVKALNKRGEKKISGEDAFVLYDTFGFPLEMTMEIADEHGCAVDINGFEKEMDKQRERGKQSWKGAGTGFEKVFEEIAREIGDTEFRGYEEDVSESNIQILYKGNNSVEKLSSGDAGIMVLKETPFYGESGGQVGDKGVIISNSGTQFRVYDTKKYNKTIIHTGEVISGDFQIGDSARAEIDTINRNLIRANHTATHLLNAALREVLGNHVKQAGSLVDPERLRFDFSHFDAMTENELEKVENIINERIWENIQVETGEMDYNEAVKTGAMAVFDEKYDDIVRVVKIDDFSMELCGGTHVTNTGHIGVFKILKEASPGAGLRRIEAVTLKGVLERYNSQHEIITGLIRSMNVTEDGIIDKADDLAEYVHSLEKEVKKLKKDSLSSDVDSMIQDAVEVNGIKIIAYSFDDVEIDELRVLSDTVRSREQNSVVCFGSKLKEKALLLFAATGNAVNKGADCGKIIKGAAKIVGGSGGGRKDIAQAGGKSPEFLENALKEAVSIASKVIRDKAGKE